MSEEIKITAEPKDNTSCSFVVDRPVYANGSAFFGESSQAQGSPLAEQLFAIAGVESILIQDDVVTVHAETGGNWMPIAKQVGNSIRSVLGSGQPAIAPDLAASMPEPEEVRRLVQDVLTNEINPAVAAHGGWVELIDVKGNELFIKMGGGCQGCGMADVTLKQGVEKSIRRAVPQIGAIMDTTDHGSGRNPYYQPSK